MRLDKLAMVNRIATERADLKQQLDHGKIEVAINCRTQDGTFTQLVTPVVREELRSRIRALDADLKALGVVIS
ncbi:hypothetical protein CA223_05415 [Sphingomonas koreensis]|uniref:Uncharacterized protein n=1 Tax=Sphingomonas koreensis TaxID=93064 RepID=A0A1L6JBT9_9SPHN|nr:hypothetical protein [Sphingomonas koreensis]APR53353.1 hypothetical protein BRX40_13770 [Sphingomonas koreensis]MDC7809952.1 hypothetical protein [Sphingomonas koreensis]RSU24525.1 hypothetical protein CA224_02065 [Sphingomonas koreensis]RSU25170.1 hypothetical protein CA222_13660 [Sphingomonas koreensis]RSU30155.1 hypothetical protein CA225_05690 [Sphingomonas koreensis]